MFEHKQNTPLAVQFLRIISDLSKPLIGGVAQLGEHLPCKQGVKGSIPFISTSGSAAPNHRSVKARNEQSRPAFEPRIGYGKAVKMNTNQ